MSQPEHEPETVDPVELANQLFREYYSRCFWHHHDDEPITREEIPLVIAGLRKHGGRQGFLAAARLESSCR
jgi:hypothetical protein